MPGNDAIHLGCHWDSACLNISRAISEGLVPFDRVTSIDDALCATGGLQALETELEKHRAHDRLESCLIPFKNVVLKAPVTRSQKVIGIGLNYRDHSEETGIAIPKSPLLF